MSQIAMNATINMISVHVDPAVVTHVSYNSPPFKHRLKLPRNTRGPCSEDGSKRDAGWIKLLFAISSYFHHFKMCVCAFETYSVYSDGMCVKPSLNCNVPVSSFVIMLLCCYKYTFYSLYKLFHLVLILVMILEYHARGSVLTSQWLQQTIKLIEFWCLICSNANPKSSQGKGCHELLATFIWLSGLHKSYHKISSLFLICSSFLSSVVHRNTLHRTPVVCPHCRVVRTGGCKTGNRNS